MAENLWEILRVGNTQSGLGRMHEAYLREPSASHAMQWGVGCLWIGDHRTAWEHFNSFNQEHPLHASVTYGMAGVAKWCMNEPIDAVECWKTGLGCDFSDTAGLGFKLPLLLFFASVVRPNVFPASEARDLLSAKSNDPRAKGWGGALARFVLGKMSQSQLREEGTGRYEDETILHHWLSDFYAGVVACANGDNMHYVEMMKRVALVSWGDYDLNSRAFLSRLWSGECFLARHEAEGVFSLRARATESEPCAKDPAGKKGAEE